MDSVLVVDDDRLIRELLRDSLQEEGYRVLVSPSAEHAVNQLSQFPVDLIITDMAMGGKSGFDLMRMLRSHALEVPVIVITAQPQDYPVAIAQALGAFAYVPKPFQVNEVMALARRAIDRAAAAPSPAPAGAPSPLSRPPETPPWLVDAADARRSPASVRSAPPAEPCSAPARSVGGSGAGRAAR
ncbi:MAG: response regulator [Planctomycetes bacterium]|nr:response regulator [Planctomycetota bacterium]